MSLLPLTRARLYPDFLGACRGSLTAPAPGLPATGQPSGGTLTSKGSEPADWAASSGSLHHPRRLAPPGGGGRRKRLGVRRAPAREARSGPGRATLTSPPRSKQIQCRRREFPIARPITNVTREPKGRGLGEPNGPALKNTKGCGAGPHILPKLPRRLHNWNIHVLKAHEILHKCGKTSHAAASSPAPSPSWARCSSRRPCSRTTTRRSSTTRSRGRTRCAAPPRTWRRCATLGTRRRLRRAARPRRRWRG